jgi:hypothetical protein
VIEGVRRKKDLGRSDGMNRKVNVWKFVNGTKGGV